MARLKGKKATASDASQKTTETVAIVKDELAESNNDESATAIAVSEVEPSKEGNTNTVQDGIAEESETKGATQDGVVKAKETDKLTVVLAVSECEITEAANVMVDSADAPIDEECTEKVAEVVEMEATVATIVTNVVTDGVDKKDAIEGVVEEEKTDNTEVGKVEDTDMKVKAKNVKRASKKKAKRLQKKKQPVAGGVAKDSADKSEIFAAGVGSTSGTKTEDGSVGEEKKGDAKAENGLSSDDGKGMEVDVEEEVKADVDPDNTSKKKRKKLKKKKMPVSGTPTFVASANNDANDVNKIHDEATGIASAVKDEDKYGVSTSKKKDLEKKEGMGLIFMCSSKTKKDCYKYKVLGMPESKKEIVDKIYKGMRLFLFDIDLRLMYGIYKAASPGGYNIETKAFKSAFPCQVRFSVLTDCKPLPEEKFKAVIKKNYYTKNKFNIQLSPEQVKNLCKLFRKENRPSNLTHRVAGAVEVHSPDRGKKRTRVVISANDVDSGRRNVEIRRDSKIKRRFHTTEAKRLPTEGHRNAERKRRAAEDHRDSVSKRRRMEVRRDSGHNRARYSDDMRDSQFRRLHVEDTRNKEYRRPLDAYERERYRSPPQKLVALPPALPRQSDDTRDSQYRRVHVEDTRDKEYRRARDTYERERYQSPPLPRQVAPLPALPPSYTYERPAVADDYYYKREPAVELRDPYASYRETIGYRYAYTSSYRDPVAYPASLSSAAYIVGPSTDVYPSGSSSAVYAPGSASTVYAPRSVSGIYAPGSASAVYAPGSVSAAYPEHTPLYRY